MSSIYGTKKCLTCGKEFEPQKAAQVTCSAKCRKKRKNVISSKSRAKGIKNIYLTIEWLNCRVEDLICQLRNKKPEPQKAANNKIKLHVIKCMNCGREFKSSNLNDLFCGQYCKQQAMEGDFK